MGPRSQIKIKRLLLVLPFLTLQKILMSKFVISGMKNAAAAYIGPEAEQILNPISGFINPQSQMWSRSFLQLAYTK